MSSNSVQYLLLGVAVRPYMSKDIKSLEKLADASQGDPDRLRQVLEELNFRSTNKANALRHKIEGWLGSPIAEATKVPAPGKKKRPKNDPGWQSDLSMRYETLRATFTEEAEILARWGVTAGLPPSMREVVFSEWRNAFAEGGTHPFGMTQIDLDSDLRKLDILSAEALAGAEGT